MLKRQVRRKLEVAFMLIFIHIYLCCLGIASFIGVSFIAISAFLVYFKFRDVSIIAGSIAFLGTLVGATSTINNKWVRSWRFWRKKERKVNTTEYSQIEK